MSKKTGIFAPLAAQETLRKEVMREDYKHTHATIVNVGGGMKGGARNLINCGTDMSSASKQSVN